MDLVLANNILQVMMNLPVEALFEAPANPSNRFIFQHQLFCLARGKFAFPIPVVVLLSKPPPGSVGATSDESFKLRFDVVWDTV